MGRSGRAAVRLPGPDEPRSVTVVDSQGRHLAALVHDRSLDDEPELLRAVSAAAGIALENGRLQVELKAQLQELEGSRGRVIEAGQQERKRLERNLHDGAQQRLIALSLELEMYERQAGRRPRGDGADRAGARRRSRSRSRSCAPSPVACTRPCSAPMGSASRSSRWPPARRFR